MSAVKPRNQRAPRKTDPSIADELSLMGLMHARVDTPAGPGSGDDGGTSEMFAAGGFGVITMPPELFGPWERALRAHLIAMVESLRAPRNHLEGAFYGVLGEMARLGKRTTPDAVVLGLCLAVAKAQGIRIKTHARDLAKEGRVRYSTLLLVQRLAVAEFLRWGVYTTKTANAEE